MNVIQIRSEGNCQTCKEIVGEGLSHVIIENEAAIATAVDAFREGHCCVIVKNHRSSISMLEEHEYIGTFDIITKVSRALENKYGAEKTYLLVIGDSRPIDHLHFHLIPKHKNLCSMGDYCIGRLLESEGDRNTSEIERHRLAKELKSFIPIEEQKEQ